jgi:hypothetical protein
VLEIADGPPKAHGRGRASRTRDSQRT